MKRATTETRAILARKAVGAAYKKRKDFDCGESVIYTDALHALLSDPAQRDEAHDGNDRVPCLSSCASV